MPTANSKPIRIIANQSDISEVEALREQLNATRAILESALEIYFAIDWRRMRFVDLTHRTAEALGYDLEELTASDPSQIFPQYSYETLRKRLQHVSAGGAELERQAALLMRKDGSVFEIEIVFRAVAGGNPDCVAVIAQDITERTATYDQLSWANHSLRTMAAVSKCRLESTSEAALMQSFCETIVEENLFLSVYVRVESTNTRENAAHYHTRNCAEPLQSLIAEYDEAAPAMEAFLAAPRVPSELHRIAPKLVIANGALPAWSKPHSRAAILLALRCDGKSIGCLAIFSKKDKAFDEAEVALLENVASEVSYGIASLRREQARAKAEKSLARRLKVESAISQFSSALLSSASIDDGLNIALPSLGRAVGADHIFVYERSAVEGLLDKSCDYVKPGIRHREQAASAIAVGETTEAWLSELSDRGCLDQRGYALPRCLSAALRLNGYSQLVSFPIRAGEHCIGFIGFCLTKTKRQWDDTTHQMLSMSALLIGAFYQRIGSENEMRMLATAINNSDEGVIISRRSGSYLDSRIVFVNEGLSRISKYEEHELLGQTPALLVSAQLDENAETPRVPQTQFQARDGSAFLAEFKIYPIRPGGGPITHYITMVVDITERHEMQSKLAFANKMESIGQLAAGIAHEINTPTQFIGDNLQYIGRCWSNIQPALERLIEIGAYDQAAAASPQAFPLAAAKLAKMVKVVPEAISDACEGSERIATIVKAMKEFSHPEKRMTVGDINKCIRTTITVARNEWKYVSDLDTDLDDTLPPVRFLPGDINQALLNLIVNAAHAIGERQKQDPSKGTIRIRSQRIDKRVRVSIADTGCGIPKSIQTSIFNPFFTTKEVGKGTGQGLYLAHQVIEKGHAGRIWFESESGVGTTFHFEIPIAENFHEQN